MVKTFKNILLQYQRSLGAVSLQQTSGTRGLPKRKLLKYLLYIDVWPIYGKMKFASLCICMGTIHLYGQTTSPLKPLGQCCLNFMWSLLRLGERKIAKMVAVHWPRWSPYPYILKNLLKSFTPEQRMPRGWTFAKIIADGRSTKITKMMVVHWHLTFFTARSSLLPYAFVWAPYICMGKILRISNDFSSSSEASGPMLFKFHVKTP